MPQRILIHDYSGHPFQPQLSRRLAARGHEVMHAYSKSILTPQGKLAATAKDSATLRFHGIALPQVIDKEAYFNRWLQERAYGRLLAEQIRAFRPDIVCSSNTPLDSQAFALTAAQQAGARFVFWLQDLQGIAIETLLGPRFSGLGGVVGRRYSQLEARLLRDSDAIVCITEDFLPTLEQWGVARQAVEVIPNWASLEELPLRPKDNPWARRHGLAGRFCFLYSGTLGMKHDPEILLRLALEQQRHPGACVVVVSEGAKVEWLRARKEELGLEALKLFPFQPYTDLPDVMGTADVLIALLHSEAGTFSVPSKVLSYHCAGRPMLLSVPPENLAARIVETEASGLVVDPSDVSGFLRSAELLRRGEGSRQIMGANARAYATRTFELEGIADRFEALFSASAARRRATRELDEPA
jgi:colanic acid biosynthesis glycosyl transferase WcaI